MSMLKKFITIPDPTDADYFLDGQIIGEIGEGHFLIRLRPAGDVAPCSKIFSITDLVDGFIFEDEAEQNRFREWTAEEPTRVIKFEK